MANILVVDRAGAWRCYWGAMPLPAGAEALGTVRRAVGDAGALLRFAGGAYRQGNAGALRSLPQRAVAAALK